MSRSLPDINVRSARKGADIVQQLGDTRRHKPTARGYAITIIVAGVLAAVASCLTGLLKTRVLIDLAEAAVFSIALAVFFIWAASGGTPRGR